MSYKYFSKNVFVVLHSYEPVTVFIVLFVKIIRWYEMESDAGKLIGMMTFFNVYMFWATVMIIFLTSSCSLSSAYFALSFILIRQSLINRNFSFFTTQGMFTFSFVFYAFPKKGHFALDLCAIFGVIAMQKAKVHTNRQ